MTKRFVVTGGAGFIGSHLVDALLQAGHDVVVVDNRSRTGDRGKLGYLADVEYVWTDLRDLDTVRAVVRNADVVVHQAAQVGVGQSMFEIQRYADANVGGTAALLQAVAEAGTVRRIVMASSMAVYGEGLYECEECGPVRPAPRPEERLLARTWEQICPACSKEVKPLPMPESAALEPTSVYGASKRGQEELCRLTGRAYGIPVTCFRYFGVYGRRQLLTNPYTGIVAMFAARLVNGRPPLVFEDGRQLRDLLHVSDVCRAVVAACDQAAPEGVFNLGSGTPVTVGRIARILADRLAPSVVAPILPEVTGTYRKGDIRHCYADMGKLSAATGFRPQVSLSTGLADAADWAAENPAPESIDQMRYELSSRKLLI